MDGIHDLGGMDGFGSVPMGGHETDASAPWEQRVQGLFRAALAQRLLNIDEFRHGIERMDPLRYLEAAYYDRWYTSVERILIEKGMVTEEELEERSALLRARPAIPSSPRIPRPPLADRPRAPPAGRSGATAPRLPSGSATR
jgi:hypothetical protein